MTESYEDIFNFGNRVKCIFCDVYISYNHSCIRQHIDGARHGELYLKRLYIRNNIVVYSNGVYCHICKTTVASSECLSKIKFHIDTSIHETNIEEINVMIVGEFLELPDKITPTGSKVKCTICNSHLAFNSHNIAEHIDGIKHRKARAVALEPLNGIFPVENTNERLWCKICNEYFANSVEDIFDHVDDDEYHRETLDSMLDLIEDEDICMDNYLTELGEYRATCNTCGVKIPCNYYNLEQHINGSRHSES